MLCVWGAVLKVSSCMARDLHRCASCRAPMISPNHICVPCRSINNDSSSDVYNVDLANTGVCRFKSDRRKYKQ